METSLMISVLNVISTAKAVFGGPEHHLLYILLYLFVFWPYRPIFQIHFFSIFWPKRPSTRAHTVVPLTTPCDDDDDDDDAVLLQRSYETS